MEHTIKFTQYSYNYTIYKKSVNVEKDRVSNLGLTEVVILVKIFGLKFKIFELQAIEICIC